MAKINQTPIPSVKYFRKMLIAEKRLKHSTLEELLHLLEYFKKELVIAKQQYDKALARYEKNRISKKKSNLISKLSSVRMRMYEDKKIVIGTNIGNIQKTITDLKYSHGKSNPKSERPIEWNDTLRMLAKYLIAAVSKGIFKQGNEQAKEFATHKFFYKKKPINKGSLSTYMKQNPINDLDETSTQIKEKLMMK